MKKYFVIILLVAWGKNICAQTWTTLSVGITADVAYISFPSPDTGFAALGNGTARKTFDAGNSWTVMNLHQQESWPFQFLSSVKGFMLDDSGIVATTNGGTNWSFCCTNTNCLWGDIFFFDQNVGFASAVNASYDSVLLYKTINGGTSWNQCASFLDYNNSIPKIYFRTSQEGYISGSDQLWRTNDGGVTWNSVYSTGGSDLIWPVTASNANDAYCATQYNMDIAKSTNGGLNWNSTTQTLPSIPYGINFINSTTGFICGGNGITAGFIMKTVNSGASWTTDYPSGQTMLCMDFPSTTRGFVGGTGGIIVRYDDTPQSINDQNISSIFICPNPATDFLILDNVSPNSNVTLVNSIGQTVMTFVTTESQTRVDVSGLAKGVYFCRVESSEKVEAIKLVLR